MTESDAQTHESAADSPPAPHADARERLVAVRAEVGKAVVGQDAAVSGLLVALLCGGHVLMEGVPGTAKTLLVRTLAESLEVGTRRVQFTPDLMPGDITGSMVIDSKAGELSFREGPVFTNLLLADEINRTPPKTQSALLEAMEEGQVSVDGVTHKLPAPFLVAATQNPVEYEGTYPLPEAQLDRFLLKVVLPIPDRTQELEIVQRHASGFDPRDVKAAGVTAVAGPADIAAGQAAVKTVQVSPEVIGYIVDIARATRESPSLSLGVSPRGADRPDAVRAGLGLADRAGLRHARRRQGAGARDPGPPPGPAPRGRARGRRRGRGARLGARLRPRPALTRPAPPWSSPVASRCCSSWGCCRSSRGRASGTVWLWLLVVTVLVVGRPAPRPEAGVADRHPRPGRRRAARPPRGLRAAGRQPRDPPGPRARARRVAAVRRRDRQPAPGRPRGR